jgi:hypothetical protein
MQEKFHTYAGKFSYLCGENFTLMRRNFHTYAGKFWLNLILRRFAYGCSAVDGYPLEGFLQMPFARICNPCHCVLFPMFHARIANQRKRDYY